jgi:hypothetical protein
LDTNSNMFEGDMERNFGGSGLDAWLRLAVDPATDSGRDMTFKGLLYDSSQIPWSKYAQCWNPFEVAGRKRPTNTGLSKHRSRAVTPPMSEPDLGGLVLFAKTGCTIPLNTRFTIIHLRTLIHRLTSL